MLFLIKTNIELDVKPMNNSVKYLKEKKNVTLSSKEDSTIKHQRMQLKGKKAALLMITCARIPAFPRVSSLCC